MKEYLLKQAADLRAAAAKLEKQHAELEKQHAELSKAVRVGGTLYFVGHEKRLIVDASGVICDSPLVLLLVREDGRIVNRFRSLEDIAKEVGVGRMYQTEPKPQATIARGWSQIPGANPFA